LFRESPDLLHDFKLFLPVSAAQARASAAQCAASANYHDATMDQKYNEDECEDDSKEMADE
jgi:histone deacetylase complex regulatory component SIN3